MSQRALIHATRQRACQDDVERLSRGKAAKERHGDLLGQSVCADQHRADLVRSFRVVMQVVRGTFEFREGECCSEVSRLRVAL